MSQYPPPYSPMQPPYGGYPAPPPPSPDELLAPARRAGVMMTVVGALFVLCGLGMGAISWMARQQEFLSGPEFAQAREQFRQAEMQSGLPIETMLLIMGVIPLAVGALFGGLGFFVRGGGFGAVVTGIVASSGVLLLLGLMILGTLVAAAANPSNIAGVCVYVVPFAIVLLLLVWLIQAARAASRVAAARQQYQAQVWQYQQYQQAYLQQSQSQPQQPGMGYHYPPPPAPPAPAPPPAAPPPPSPETKDPPDAAAPQG
jgi:hypothetical protein